MQCILSRIMTYYKFKKSEKVATIREDVKQLTSKCERNCSLLPARITTESSILDTETCDGSFPEWMSDLVASSLQNTEMLERMSHLSASRCLV